VIYGRSDTAIRDILDGTSQTRLVAENDTDKDDLEKFKSFYVPNWCGPPAGNCEFAKFWSAVNLITTAHGINGDAGYVASGVVSRQEGPHEAEPFCCTVVKVCEIMIDGNSFAGGT